MNRTAEKMVSRRASILALCGLAGALLLGVLPIADWVVNGDSIGRLLTREVIVWCCALAILLWLTFVERLPLSSIGFCRPTSKGVIFGVLAGIVLTAIQVIQFTIVIPLFHLNTAAIMARLQGIMHTPYWYRVLLVLRAAVTEEILFRGYMIEKVRQLTRSTLLAVIVSVAAFTAAHLRGWGPVQLISVGGGAVVFALLYVWRRDLPSNMLAHFLADAAGFLTS
jgi:membrane protease YdiL (CAAX protease family)